MQAVVMMAHQLDGLTLDRFESLRVGAEFDKFLLLEDAQGTCPQSRCLRTFSFAGLRSAGYTPIRNALVPGSNHFPVIDFIVTNQYEYVWSVEYDVVFKGRWSTFLELQTSDADLLTAGVARYREIPRWPWWGSLLAPVPLGPDELVRSFNPVYRLSKRAAAHLKELYHNGWVGHHEVTMATALSVGGFRIEDFGGCGTFVRESNYNRWYNRQSYFHKPRDLRKLREMTDVLVHPVKGLE